MVVLKNKADLIGEEPKKVNFTHLRLLHVEDREHIIYATLENGVSTTFKNKTPKEINEKGITDAGNILWWKVYRYEKVAQTVES